VRRDAAVISASRPLGPSTLLGRVEVFRPKLAGWFQARNA